MERLPLAGTVEMPGGVALGRSVLFTRSPDPTYPRRHSKQLVVTDASEGCDGEVDQTRAHARALARARAMAEAK